MVILVMGTTGAGKTTVGKLIAHRLRWTFLDADDFHPPANIEKMKHGIPLTDADRAPWLANIHSRLLQLSEQGRNAVLACSALKQTYRDTLSAGLDFRTVYLRGTYEEMRKHILARRGHFAGESILAGQFADLEEPTDALTLDVAGTPDEIAKQAIEKLHL
ncbi:MAG TPA: gluconokinase [Candidatus Acidoferrum sp.]|nr:gluconokinase [Candidatus Acidoferrum sp.]